MPFNFVGEKKTQVVQGARVKSDFTETESLRLLPLRCFQTIFCCSEPAHICVILSSSAQAPEAAGYHCCLAMRFVDKMEKTVRSARLGGGGAFEFRLGENASCRLVKVLKRDSTDSCTHDFTRNHFRQSCFV